MLKFEDSNKGSRRLLSEDEQDLGEILRLELDRLVSLLHQLMRLPKNASGPRFRRLGRVHRSISEFVTSIAATTTSPAPFRTAGARRDRRCDVTISLCVERSTQSANPL